MPDLPISGLTQSTTLQGSELLVNVQGGVTKKQTVQDILDANLPITSSGITISGDIIPTTPRGASLGTVTNPFSSIFVSSGSIYVESDIPGSEPGIITNVDGNISIDSAGFRLISGSTTPFEITQEGLTIIKTPTPQIGKAVINVTSNPSSTQFPLAAAAAGGVFHGTGGATGATVVTLDNFENTPSTETGNFIMGRRFRGTPDAPTQAKDGDQVTVFAGVPYNGVSFIQGSFSSMQFKALGDTTTSSTATSWELNLVPTGSNVPQKVIEAITDRVTISGSFEADLQENYVWLGDSNNRNIETPVSSLTTYLTGSLVKSAYISCYNSSSISLATSGSEQVIDFTSIWTENSISLVDNNKFTFAEPGVYKLEFLTTIENSTADEQDSWFWVKLNGTNFPNSATKVTVRKRKSNGEHTHQLVSISILGVAQTAGDYVQMYWTGEDTALGMPSEAAAGDYPATPSVTLNIIRVG